MSLNIHHKHQCGLTTINVKGTSFSQKNLFEPLIIQWLDVRLLKCEAWPQTISGFNPLSLQAVREARLALGCT